MHQPGVNLVVSRLQVRCSSHYTTEPHVILHVLVNFVSRSRDEREQRKCRLAAVQEKRQCLETEVKELAAQSRRHASDLNAIRATLKHLIEQRDTLIGYCVFTDKSVLWFCLRSESLRNLILAFK